ncbi:hypothetical protein JCM8208_005828 [Rhodotorula glutinis]
MGNQSSKDKRAKRAASVSSAHSQASASTSAAAGPGDPSPPPPVQVGAAGDGGSAAGGQGEAARPDYRGGAPAGTSTSGSGAVDLAPSRSRSSTTTAATALSRTPTANPGGAEAGVGTLTPSASTTTDQGGVPGGTILSNPMTPVGGSAATTPTTAQPPSASSSSSAVPPAGLLSTSPTAAPRGGAAGASGTALLGGTFDVDDMISRLLDAGYSGKVTKSVCLKNAEITAICQAAREVFLSQPTLVELSPPVKIVGDVHGQYSDLIRLFEMCGFPPNANYLFLGDYVDRGKQSLETILLLLCYKVKYPENFFLLRGNHECANVTRVYGFYDECKRRCNIKVWKTFIDVFNCLPIAAVVASKIFCVHGGLSPSLSSMDDIRRISRPTDVPDYGLLNDLLWSDPSDTALDWEDNERGVSYCFGKTVIGTFLARYDFDLICRAHMVVEDGYEFWCDRALVTIFSAPNYCGEFDNFGAVMSVSLDLLCSFELLKPLDTAQLKRELAKTRRRLSSSASAASAT